MPDYIAQEPIWLQAWIYWMVVVNTASFLFLKQIEARWVLAAWIGNLIFMILLYENVGYVRLLGLSHVIFWTPLLVYLFRRRDKLSGATGVWLRILMATLALSLVVDYVDVARYVMGDREPSQIHREGLPRRDSGRRGGLAR